MLEKVKVISVPEDHILNRIILIRGQKVMLDKDLAELYGVETKHLKRSVRRNIDRFPYDFMFELTKDELKNLRYKIGTSSWGGIRYPPLAFTEHGVAMLSSVLKSRKAILINMEIIRIFIRIRQYLFKQKEIEEKLSDMEKHLSEHDNNFLFVFEYIKMLDESKQDQENFENRRRIGFKPD